jgi:N-acetylmuramoyl-L-alanine amidase
MMMQNTHHRIWAQWLFLPLAACCVFIFSVAFHKAPAGSAPAKNLKVVLDAGHGGIDPGAVVDGIREKDIALALVQELTKQATSSSIQFVLTREGDDLPVPGSVNESLKYRVDLVKSAEADLMLSLHVGAAQKTSTNIRGIMAYVGTDATANVGESKTLASALLGQLEGGPLPVESAVQQRTSTSVYILEKNTKPAVLLEMGFVTHPSDVQVLADQQKMKDLARRLLAGLENYAAQVK